MLPSVPCFGSSALGVPVGESGEPPRLRPHLYHRQPPPLLFTLKDFKLQHTARVFNNNVILRLREASSTSAIGLVIFRLRFTSTTSPSATLAS